MPKKSSKRREVDSMNAKNTQNDVVKNKFEETINKAKKTNNEFDQESNKSCDSKNNKNPSNQQIKDGTEDNKQSSNSQSKGYSSTLTHKSKEVGNEIIDQINNKNGNSRKKKRKNNKNNDLSNQQQEENGLKNSYTESDKIKSDSIKSNAKSDDQDKNNTKSSIQNEVFAKVSNNTEKQKNIASNKTECKRNKVFDKNEKKNQAGSKDEGQFKHTFKIVINDKASSNKNENCKKVKNENNSTVSFRSNEKSRQREERQFIHSDKHKSSKSHTGIDKNSVNENMKSNNALNRYSKSTHDHKINSFNEEKNLLITEIDKDLFDLPKDYSLAHCVAEDLRMGAGIAVAFKQKFGGIGKLVDQKLKVGDTGIVNRHNQNVFYLITKRNSSGKPSMMTLEKALSSLLIKMKNLSVTKLGIPKIGCGLDGLDWSEVKSLIEDIFSGSGIDIIVCIPSNILDKKAPSFLNVYMTPKNLWEMENQTNIIIFVDLKQIRQKNWTNNCLDKVNARYPFKENFLRDVKNMKFEPGEIKVYTVNNEKIICVSIQQDIFYSSIEEGFKKIGFSTKSNNYLYLAIQCDFNNSCDYDFKHLEWIVLIFRSVCKNCELWICGYNNVKEIINYDEYRRSMNNYSRNYSRNFNPSNQITYKNSDSCNTRVNQCPNYYQNFHQRHNFRDQEKNSNSDKVNHSTKRCG